MILIKAVGDICPGDKVILGTGVCSLMKKKGVAFPLKNVEGQFDGADIVLGNLEGLLCNSVEKSKTPNKPYCGLPSFAQELRRIGFTVISMANNHVLEYGPEAFNETVETLERSDLMVAGLRDPSGEYYSKPVIIEKDNLSVGVLAYNWIGKDKFPDADKYISQSHDSVVNYTWNRNRFRDLEHRRNAGEMNKNVINDIRKLKTRVDVVLLMPHWGYEFVHHPPIGVILEAKSFIDAGVALIIGNHPHVIQGFEKYGGGWIYYSLGNFLFDLRAERTKISSILSCTIKGKNDIECNVKYLKVNSKFQPTLIKPSEESKIKAFIGDENQKIRSGLCKQELDDDKVYKEFEKQYNKLKYHSIVLHFSAVFLHPGVIRIIMRKAYSLLELIGMRIRGERIRW